jgi:hypothetical protein
MTLTDVRVLDSVTQLDGPFSGVVVAGSHGGVYAGYLAARAGARGVVLSDAGVGKDDAGIGSLPYLGDLGVPAAAVDHESARIGDGADLADRGVTSHVNEVAKELGCVEGMPALECAARMREGSPIDGETPEYGQGRTLLVDGDPPVWGMDSLSLIAPEHAGTIAITASHGARLAGERESYIAADVAAAAFNDAGVGADDVGISRLPVLDERSIPAVTVSADSARIGDAVSAWDTGVISHANATASALGVAAGDDLATFAERVRAAES